MAALAAFQTDQCELNLGQLAVFPDELVDWQRPLVSAGVARCNSNPPIQHLAKTSVARLAFRVFGAHGGTEPELCRRVESVRRFFRAVPWHPNAAAKAFCSPHVAHAQTPLARAAGRRQGFQGHPSRIGVVKPLELFPESAALHLVGAGTLPLNHAPQPQGAFRDRHETGGQAATAVGGDTSFAG